MTYQEVDALVASLGLPYAYYQFTAKTAQPCPFLCFYFSDSDDFEADNTIYQKIRPLIIELYTDDKDFALEAQIETALAAAGLVYSRSEVYVGSERMYQITYEMEVIINA
ncbi:MAG: hypothetical protein IKS25_05485 [Oscillospiraceae bacterium]|nr:hypothetical protein [Oscillospiraceae bacterium]